MQTTSKQELLYVAASFWSIVFSKVVQNDYEPRKRPVQLTWTALILGLHFPWPWLSADFRSLLTLIIRLKIAELSKDMCFIATDWHKAARTDQPQPNSVNTESDDWWQGVTTQFKLHIWTLSIHAGTAEQLWDWGEGGGAPLVTQYWGGAQSTFSY